MDAADSGFSPLIARVSHLIASALFLVISAPPFYLILMQAISQQEQARMLAMLNGANPEIGQSVGLFWPDKA
jgi:hypothetical protein